MADTTRLQPDQVLDGRYRVIRVLGEGTMGTVYLAEHTLIGRRVAIKVLRDSLATDPAVVERFMNEARAAGTLGHDNICESTDMGYLADVPYIVLEYLEGGVLSDEIQRPLSIRRTLRIGQQIASALHAAHAAGIVHRDLKSDNVFLTDREGRPDHVKVLDFGISEFVDASRGRDAAGLVAGTPEFMAPEQITSPTNVDARADVYALGVILFHMVAGQRPFIGDELEPLLQRILSEPVPPLGRDAPPRLERLIQRMMAKQPGDRPQTMAEVAEELAACNEAYQTSPVPRPVLDDVSAPVGFSSAAGPPVAPRPAGPPRAVYAAGAVGVTGAALAAIVLLRGGDASSPGSPEPTPAPPAITTVPPQVPVAPVVPTTVGLEVRTDVAGATFTFRRRNYPVGTAITVAPSEFAELVEVSAPGRTTRRFWLTMDRPATLTVALAPGKGATEATEAETLVALGEATAPDTTPGPPADAGTGSGGVVVAVTRPPQRPVGAGAGRPGAERPDPARPDAGRPTPGGTGVATHRVDGPGDGGGTGKPTGEPTTPPQPADARVAPAPVGSRPDAAPAVVTPAARPTIDQNGVRQVVRSHIAEVQRCYERGRMDNLDLAGRVVVRIAIGRDGRAQSTSIESSTLNAPTVDACVAKAVRTWQFPAPQGGPIEISYPFVLK